MCGEMVTVNARLPEKELIAAGKRFFETVVRPRIFPEMQHLTHCLAERGCELWAVSSTNDWVIRTGTTHFGIPPERVIAAAVYIENGRATDRLIQVPTDEGKAVAVRERIGRGVDAAFGNSIHDVALLEVAKYAFAVNPNPDLEGVASQRGWEVYRPDPV